MEEKNTNSTMDFLKKFYIVDLMVRLVKGKNITALIYLVLNTALIMTIFFYFTGTVGGMFVGLLIYIICVCAALSPIGEAILRHSHGCNKITDQSVLDRLQPLFDEVYGRAIGIQTAYNINRKIKLYINDEREPNAFALGRSTVCVTKGLLALPDDQIKAILGHEMGHLANHDTDLIMLITVGNFLVSVLMTIIRVLIIVVQVIFNIIGAFCGENGSVIVSVFSTIIATLTLVFINVFTWLWTKMGVLLVMKSSRNQEFAADRFSCELGYSEPLLAFFDSINTPAPTEGLGFIEKLKEATGLFAVLTSTHPTTQKRIDAIKSNLASGVIKTEVPALNK